MDKEERILMYNDVDFSWSRVIGNKEEISLLQYYPVLTYVIIGYDPIKRRNAMS